MKRLTRVGLLLLAVVFVLSTACGFAASKKLIRVGIVNLPPEESGYRQANVEDMNRVFSKGNGYDAKQTNTADVNEQMAAAMGYIRDGVDYLLISAAHASGWDNVLQAAKRAGVKVILFDRLIDTDPSNYEAALVSDMHYEGKLATDWVLKNVPKTDQSNPDSRAVGERSRRLGATPRCSKPPMKVNSTLCGMEQAATLGALRKPVRWLKPRLPQEKISTSSMPRTTVWLKALFRPSRRPVSAMARMAKSR